MGDPLIRLQADGMALDAKGCLHKGYFCKVRKGATESIIVYSDTQSPSEKDPALATTPGVSSRYQTHSPSFSTSRSLHLDSFWIFSLLHRLSLGARPESFHTPADKPTLHLTITFSVPVTIDVPQGLSGLLTIPSTPGKMKSPTLASQALHTQHRTNQVTTTWPLGYSLQPIPTFP